ncbi:MAG: aryl-sulfate sulfotransferase [Nanoarchaeota archaeon]|nr:aryl-sulfate sulfotransferase [Nanoarchaeota archaeon]
MTIKSFLKKVNEIADEKNNQKTKLIFDEKLSGVKIHNKKKVCKGYRLYENKLIDIDGKIIKTFPTKYINIIHKKNIIGQSDYEKSPWGIWDKNNKLIWKKNNTIHHDIFITKKNTIITLEKETQEYKKRNVEFDTIVEYDLNGKKIEEISIWKQIKEFQKYHKNFPLDLPKIPLIPLTAKIKEKSPWGGNYDYYHANSIQIIPKNKSGINDKRFQEGNIIISFRHGSLIYILDKKTKNIVWNLGQNDIKNKIEGQHGAQILENGNLLIFDNGRYRGWSRVIELNPINLEIIWEYKANNFFTVAQGYAQRLENGNTLITESEKGRVIEVTKEKEIVWEFYHNEKQNKKNSMHPECYGKRQWIYRMIHYNKI